MTITLKPIHLAIVAAFLAGILIAVGIVFAFDGASKSQPEAPTAANIDEPPTPSPTAEPTETPAPTATTEPTPEPTAAPEIRSCEEIKADPTYRSPEERDFFQANCLGDNEPAPVSNNSPPATTSNSAQATAAEKLYRDRANATLIVAASSIQVYATTPSLGAYNDLLTLGTLMRKFAQELDRLPPTPPRFVQVHNALKASLLAIADYILEFQNLHTDNEFYAWLDEYLARFDTFIAALDDYSLVVGVDLPEIFAPQ
jgi:hypothetical protein